jgi:hypothetical protein
MTTKKQLDAMHLYAAIMEEAKIRLFSIDMALGGATILPHQLVREFCFLQLRMLCELVALGCLAAHGDIEETTKLRKEWSADRIMEKLEALHPTFYPRPVRQTRHPEGHWHMENVSEPFLTKQELLSLNGKSGDVLHRGNLKKLLSPKTPIQTNFPDMAEWGRKISVLLNMHAIFLLGGEIILCKLRNPGDKDRVQVLFAEDRGALGPGGSAEA